MSQPISRIFTQFLQSIGPCLLLGVAIACTIGIFILFSYMLLWGMLIGLILWVSTLIRRHLFSRNTPSKNQPGRVIDHEKNK